MRTDYPGEKGGEEIGGDEKRGEEIGGDGKRGEEIGGDLKRGEEIGGNGRGLEGMGREGDEYKADMAAEKSKLQIFSLKRRKANFL